ncbi:MAG TPA: 2-C-methyl-D-erythritol 2,4-cyclodiphosphate synthase, partial [Candidatus Omnitrophica bacterium]|nr:2-C-methyl-D-erythritol 2,4-cyclodiphosphate synthase [Candidatus Omnitrophota bacterium]
MDIRIGFGFDSHKLVTGRKLILGGIEIPYEKGALAVSDGDVVIHALCDALLGAIGEKDLGEYFPDDNPENINRNSKEFLKQIWKKVCSLNYKISNIDITIIID